MSGSLNKVFLIGNVGNDPDIKKTQGGELFVRFSLATSESWTDKKNGERKSKTEWHRIVVFNDAIAKVVQKYVKKGTKLFIEGALQTQKYDKNGVDTYSTEIVLARYRGQLVLLGGFGAAAAEAPPEGGDDDAEIPV